MNVKYALYVQYASLNGYDRVMNRKNALNTDAFEPNPFKRKQKSIMKLEKASIESERDRK